MAHELERQLVETREVRRVNNEVDSMPPMAALRHLYSPNIAPRTRRPAVIAGLLLIFAVVAGAPGIAMACPDGYYRCGGSLCCPK